MTAPLRSGEPIIVKVALGDRSYDIVIGRGLLGSLGARIAKLRPGARAAIVTDETVARHHLAAAESRAQGGRDREFAHRGPPGERSKSFATFEKVCEALIAARIERSDLVVALGGGVIGDLAGFRRGVARRGLDFVQVPTTLLAQVDSSVGGKTGINSRARQESGRRFPPAGPGARRYRAARHAAEARIRAPAMPRWSKYGLLGDAGFFAWLEANWQDVFAGGPGARARHRGQLPRQGRHRRARRARDRRARAAQSRPHLRPRAGSRRRLFRRAAAWRGGRARHGAGLRVLGAARAGSGGGRRARRCAIFAAVGLPTQIKDVPGGAPDVDRLMDADRAGQEGEARQADLHPGARHRAGIRRARRRCRRGARLPRREARRPDERQRPQHLSVAIFLLAANAFFVAAEFALVKARGFRIDALAKRQPLRRARSRSGC